MPRSALSGGHAACGPPHSSAVRSAAQHMQILYLLAHEYVMRLLVHAMYGQPCMLLDMSVLSLEVSAECAAPHWLGRGPGEGFLCRLAAEVPHAAARMAFAGTPAAWHSCTVGACTALLFGPDSSIEGATEMRPWSAHLSERLGSACP